MLKVFMENSEPCPFIPPAKDSESIVDDCNESGDANDSSGSMDDKEVLAGESQVEQEPL